MVCERWINNFVNFINDMGPRPDGYSLGRKDNNGNYTPENCRWETIDEQANNKTNTVFLTLNGNRKTLVEWSRITGIHMKTIKSRLRRGRTEENALTTPVLERTYA